MSPLALKRPGYPPEPRASPATDEHVSYTRVPLRGRSEGHGIHWQVNPKTTGRGRGRSMPHGQQKS